MSQSLARRTGTVGALVAAAGMTMVAGMWPALGMASAADTPPGQIEDGAHAAAAPGQVGAPGQVAKEVVESVPGPVADNAVPEPSAPQESAPGQVKKDAAAPDATAPDATAPGAAAPVAQESAPGQVKKEQVDDAATGLPPSTTTGAEAAPTDKGKPAAPPAVAGQPVTGPATGVDSKNEAAGPPAPKQAGAQPAVGPATGVGSGSTKADPGTTSTPIPPPAEPAPADRAKGQAAPAPASGSRQGQRGGETGGNAAPLAPRPVRPVQTGPQIPAPAATPVQAGQTPVPPVRVGPAVPVAAVPVQPDRKPAPSGAAGQGVAGQLSRKGLLAAADPFPLRPTGAGGSFVSQPARPAQPAQLAQPAAVTIDLAAALPALANNTAEAVARTPELPLGIGAVVVLFLLLQGRVDRRDPKLTAARLEGDEPLVFRDTGQIHLRMVTAA